MSPEVVAVKIDLSQARKTVKELLDALEELDGAEPDTAPTRAANRQRADITRRLLYLSHLGNRASVQIMDTYHDYKIHDAPAGE